LPTTSTTGATTSTTEQAIAGDADPTEHMGADGAWPVVHAPLAVSTPPTQELSDVIPACKSCHPVASANATVSQPNLKAAYHRQCLNCHSEWMHGNACAICHKPRAGTDPLVQAMPTPDDIVGRMHPPIPEPQLRK
jgi:hypothetical protein